MSLLFLDNKKSLNPLVSYIDLLFLLVCFFIFLVKSIVQETFEQQKFVHQITKQLGYSEFNLEQVEEKLIELNRLAEVAKEYLNKEEAQKTRFQQRPVVQIKYQVAPESGVYYEERYFEMEAFLTEVVAPIRQESWISFVSYANPNIPFGRVIDVRRALLKNREEFDTFWSNTQ